MGAELVAARLREGAAKPKETARARWAVHRLEVRLAPRVAALARAHLASIGSLLDETAVAAFALERALLDAVLHPRRAPFTKRFEAALPAAVAALRRNEWYFDGGAAAAATGADPRARALVTALIEANERLEPRRARVVYAHLRRGLGIAE